MAIISDKLNKILSAVFGKDVRQALHDGLDAINKETESTTSRQDYLDRKYDEQIKNMTLQDPSSAEIVDMRVAANGKTFEKAGDRLDNFDEQLDNNTNKIDELNNLKADKDNVKNIYYDGVNDLKQNSNLSSITFRRKHSLNLRKTLKYNLANMAFDRNFIDVQYSDLYPNLESVKNQTESIENGEYTIKQTTSTRNQVRRLFSGFNIFSSYEFKAHTINGGTYGCRTGFSFSFPNLELNIMLGFKTENKIDLMSEKFVSGASQGVETHTELDFDYSNGIQVCITNFNNSFEVYFFENGRYNFKYKIPVVDVNTFDKALNGRVSLYCRQDNNETITFTEVSNFYDCGLTQGDIRPIRYRNGLPIIRDGKIFFTLLSRFNEYSYQTIFSKSVNGNDYKLEGVLLFEYNNKIYSDIASSIVYDNEKGRFIIWNGAFSQNHILGYGDCYSDILYGVNIISMTAMTKQTSGQSQPSITDDKLFYAKYQDEDPDIIYNEKTNKWNLVICRTDSTFDNNVYNYYLF